VFARRGLTLLLLVLGVLGVAASDDDRNRQLLDRWRAEPEHYARLQKDLRDFYALPADRQAAIRKLDRELHQQDGATQRRLYAVMDRYAVWLERLPEEQRRLLAAAAPAERLQLIRELRDQEFIDRLPQRTRDKVKDLTPEQRKETLKKLRQDEHDNIRAWQGLAARQVVQPPASLKELPQEAQKYVEQYLLPRLSEEERRRLQAAGGKGEPLARVLTELADRHPVLPPLPGGPVTRLDELPPKVRALLHRVYQEKPGRLVALRLKEGKWPEYALACVELVPAGRRAELPPLGASRPLELSPEIRGVITTLGQKSPEDAAFLRRAEGHWPEYPYRLLELARKNKLYLPGMMLPGPRE
jgi:hypothetical protein